MKIIGVDLGGTRIKAGIVEDNSIVRKIEIETEAKKGKEQVVQKILNMIEMLNEKDVKGIGLGVPGMINQKTGEMLICPMIPTLQGTNLKKIVEKKFGKKTEIDNEVTAATIAELKYGAGKGYKNMVMFTIGTGIGGGIVVDGKIWRGKGNAGEVGHMTINFDGMKSTCCRNYGCFQEYASIGAIQRIYGREISPKEIAYKAQKGDKKAKQAYEEIGRYIGIGVVNLINIFDPEIIIIGGQMTKSWKLFEKTMKETIKERYMLNAKVVPAKLEEPGIIGAALLVQGGK